MNRIEKHVKQTPPIRTTVLEKYGFAITRPSEMVGVSNKTEEIIVLSPLYSTKYNRSTPFSIIYSDTVGSIVEMEIEDALAYFGTNNGYCDFYDPELIDPDGEATIPR